MPKGKSKVKPLPKPLEETKGGYPLGFDEEADVELKSPDDKMNLWKPEEVGEYILGKLMMIATAKFGPILRFSTDEGIVSVPVSHYLSDIDFEPYVGRRFYIRFEGKAGRNCRLFRVTVLKEKE